MPDTDLITSVRTATRGEDSRAPWRAAASQARVYLAGGAWSQAHDLLFPVLSTDGIACTRDPDAFEAIGLMLVACWHLDHHDHVRVWTHRLREGLALAEPMSAEARALAMLHRLRQLADSGVYDRALELADELRGDWFAGVSAWSKAYLSLVLARIHAHVGHLDAAERWALDASARAEHAGSDALQGETLTGLANVLSARRDLEGAQRMLARAGTHYRRAGDDVGRCTTLLNRAWVLSFLGDLDNAEASFNDAKTTATSIGRHETVLRARLGLGWLAARRGDTDQARRLLLPAWLAARRRGLPREEALALEYLADAYLLSEDCVAWLPRARVAVGLCRRLSMRLASTGDVALECRIREAMLACVEGAFEAAGKLARDAIAHAGRARMPWEEAQAHRVLALAQVMSGQVGEARETFHRSLSLFASLGERFERWYVGAWISRLSAPSGDAGTGIAESDEIYERRELNHWLRHPVFGLQAWGGPPGSPRLPERVAEESPGTRPGRLAARWTELGLVTRSPALRDTLLLAETYASEDVAALVLGETGTGKDLLARGLHELSGRAGAFVAVNCAAAQRQLFAAELFGARRGAYTGATEHRRGLIQEAAGGTLFFDEIADLDADAQGYLLRFLDTGEVRPLGDTQGTRVVTRVVAATRRDLRRLVGDGAFREDLYMRLAAAVLTLPPLRDRIVDLPPLLEMLWSRAGGAAKDREAVFTPETLCELRRRPWPGNVRELNHTVLLGIPLVRARGPAAACSRMMRWAGFGWRERDAARPASRAGARPCDCGSAALATRRLSRGAPAMPSATRPSSHRILVKDPAGNWPGDMLLHALDLAKGHVPTAARILGLSRSQAYRLYKRMRLQQV